MTLAQLIPLAINISLFLMVFALGLKTVKGDALYLANHPGLLIRSVLSMNVVMVAFAIIVALVFPLPRTIEIALIALAISPVPPILPGKQTKAGGSYSYAISLLATASILAIVLAPISVGVAGDIFGRETGISPGKIASIVMLSIVLPLAAGILMRFWLPEIGERIAHPISLAATILLVVAVLPVLFNAWPAVWALTGNGLVLVLVAFTLVGLAVGHFLGGPDEHERTVLALATATRHPGVAIAIVSLNFPDEKAALAVVLYHLVIGTLAAIPYVRQRRGAAVRSQA
jgi:BASS family bile acid:Na+ symporter